MKKVLIAVIVVVLLAAGVVQAKQSHDRKITALQQEIIAQLGEKYGKQAIDCADSNGFYAFCVSLANEDKKQDEELQKYIEQIEEAKAVTK